MASFTDVTSGSFSFTDGGGVDQLWVFDRYWVSDEYWMGASNAGINEIFDDLEGVSNSFTDEGISGIAYDDSEYSYDDTRLSYDGVIYMFIDSIGNLNTFTDLTQ